MVNGLGGTWTAQNKVRPGAYINFDGITSASLTSGTRGTVAVPMELPWGPTDKLITITSSDYTRGRTLSTIGLSLGTEAIKPLQEVFKNATIALVGRINGTGATIATATIGQYEDPDTGTEVDIIVSANYAGSLGNSITISVVANTVTGKFDFITLVNGTERDRQSVVNLGNFQENDFITITGPDEFEFAALAGTSLAGGTDGTADADSYASFLGLCEDTPTWNTLAANSEEVATSTLVATFIENLRENEGRKAQAVVADYNSANYEGVISVNQGYIIEADDPDDNYEVSVGLFTCWVAGITAGANINESNTYALIQGATAIINPMSSSEIEQALVSGMFVISRRQDGGVVVEKDINTLFSYPSNRNYAFTKNRVIRTLDDIANQITQVWENSYIGKVSNNDVGRNLFRVDIINYLSTLQDIVAIQNFAAATDVEVLPGIDIESVVVNLAIQPVDSMEKLYMTVQVS